MQTATNWTFEHRLRACLHCEHGAKPCAGACPCGIDGMDTVEHATEGYCPIGRYRMGAGDWIAAVAFSVGLRRAARYVERLTGKPCGCKARQVKANARFRGLWEWLGEWAAI